MVITLKRSTNPEEYLKYLKQQKTVIKKAKDTLEDPHISIDNKFRDQNVRAGVMVATSILSEKWEKLPSEEKEKAIIEDGFKKNPKGSKFVSPKTPFQHQPSRKVPEQQEQDSKQKNPYRPFSDEPKPRLSKSIQKQPTTVEEPWTDITPVQAPRIAGGVCRVRLHAWENTLAISLYTDWPDYGCGDVLNPLESAERILDEKIELAQKELPEVKQKETTSHGSSLNLNLEEDESSDLSRMRVLKPPNKQEDDK